MKVVELELVRFDYGGSAAKACITKEAKALPLLTNPKSYLSIFTILQWDDERKQREREREGEGKEK